MCVCVYVRVHPCERGRANGAVARSCFGALDDGCDFTLYAIPSVPIRGRLVSD